MQLSSPFFLLILLPLSFLLLLPLPRKTRLSLLAPLFAAWYVAANYGNTVGILAVLSLPLFSYLLALPAPDLLPRVRMAVGVLLPLAAVLTARLTAELGMSGMRYPYGITLVALASISATVDRLRSKAPVPQNPLIFITYILFFPVLALGPVIRYRQFIAACDAQEERLLHCHCGVRLYMWGFIKQLAIAAPMYRAIGQILAGGDGVLNPFTALMLPLFAFLFLYFLVGGCTDMARGIAELLGITTPRNQKTPFSARHPLDLLFFMHRSLTAYLTEYVGAPLARRGTPAAKRLAALLILLCFLLFFRARPEILLFMLPLAALCLLPRLPRNRWGRAALYVLSFLSVAFFALAAVTEDPISLFRLYATVLVKKAPYQFYLAYSAISGARLLYVTVGFCVLALLFSRFYPLWLRKLPSRARSVCRTAQTVLLLTLFLFSFLYFLPQFPQYADLPYLGFFV